MQHALLYADSRKRNTNCELTAADSLSAGPWLCRGCRRWQWLVELLSTAAIIRFLWFMLTLTWQAMNESYTTTIKQFNFDSNGYFNKFYCYFCNWMNKVYLIFQSRHIIFINNVKYYIYACNCLLIGYMSAFFLRRSISLLSSAELFESLVMPCLVYSHSRSHGSTAHSNKILFLTYLIINCLCQ